MALKLPIDERLVIFDFEIRDGKFRNHDGSKTYNLIDAQLELDGPVIRFVDYSTIIRDQLVDARSDGYFEDGPPVAFKRERISEESGKPYHYLEFEGVDG